MNAAPSETWPPALPTGLFFLFFGKTQAPATLPRTQPGRHRIHLELGAAPGERPATCLRAGIHPAPANTSREPCVRNHRD